jgi:hypothetical protein
MQRYKTARTLSAIIKISGAIAAWKPGDRFVRAWHVLRGLLSVDCNATRATERDEPRLSVFENRTLSNIWKLRERKEQ